MRRVLCVASLAVASLAQDRTLSSDSAAWQVAFVDEGRTVAAVCGDNKVHLWDAQSGSRRAHDWKHAMARQRVFVPQSNEVATLFPDGKVRVFNALTGAVVGELPAVPAKAPLSEPEIAVSGSLVATASTDVQTSRNTILIRDVASGKEIRSIPAGIGGTSVVGFSPDRSVLVAGSFDTDLRMWTVASGELIRLVTDLPVAMFAMAFSPDGNWLATAGVDRIVYLWDTKTWKVVRKITGQPEMISAIAFSPDGKRILTGGFNALTMNAPVKLIL